MNEAKKTEFFFPHANNRDISPEGTEQKISETNEPSSSSLPHSRQVRNFCCFLNNKLCQCIAKGVHGGAKSRVAYVLHSGCQMASLYWRVIWLLSSTRGKGADRSKHIPCLLRPALCLLTLPCLTAYAS